MRRERGPVIAVSGPPGGGKTTYARRLAERLGLRYYSAGMLFRRLASELGVSLERLSKLAEKDPSIDLEIDRRTLEVARQGSVVVEGHLTAWVLAGIADVRIFVTAPLHVRVARIASREGRPLRDVLQETLEREISQWVRYRNYYGIDIRDLSIFDLVIDTSGAGVEEVYRIIEGYVCAKLAAKYTGFLACRG